MTLAGFAFRVFQTRIAEEICPVKRLLLWICALGIVCGSGLRAQDNKDIMGTWQGTLQAGRALRIVVKISEDDGKLKSVFYSIDQGAGAIPINTTTVQGSSVTLAVEALDGKFEGKLSADRNSMVGTWTQGPRPLPLTLVRATKETEWAIPEPPARIPPMAADADPSFEVATIKPTKPNERGKMFTVRGGRFVTVNTSLTELITFAYGLHPKQVTGGPEWMETEHFDIEAKPDTPGLPNNKQLNTMVRKLLAERFKLKFHEDRKELSVYALTVAKSGPKMTKSTSEAAMPGLFFRALGVLTVQNATMQDFAELMQSAVLDRPVVDQTGLVGRWNFLLKWTPDDSQFGGMGAKVPPPTDAADAPPNLYTAIQEQLGLKLEATKAPAEVMVIDHAEKPSAN
jgi:uncharacterized protein (TIGR03435 family)